MVDAMLMTKAMGRSKVQQAYYNGIETVNS
jgi:hypothetical protein